MDQGYLRVVYFTVGGGKEERAQFPSDIPPDELKDLFRAAAEAGPHDILKLYTECGHLVNISPRLVANSPETRYRLEVVAAHCNGMVLDQVGIDLLALEERVAKLEKKIRVDFDELPPVVQDLKQQVDNFRTKLESTEHLSWLGPILPAGFYKELHLPPATESARPYWNRLQYRRKSETEKKKVFEKFKKICDVAVSEDVRKYLRMPTFDNWQWEDEEILLLLQQMFLDLDLTNKFGIEIPTLRQFLYEVYKNYNEVPFHNFRHCFCVAQMMYGIAWYVDLPGRLGYLETLILITSCICHDLDHPGYNNIYQINAKTELALRYNDISPLENHHCSIAFQVLENPECNIFRNLSPENYKKVREGMIRCILATDMARHNEILNQFKDIISVFDFDNKAHTNLLSMVLIKVADISNEARPMDVAEPWLDCLLQEFFTQSDAEKLEGLPVTPFMDREKITKPSSQCSFIGYVLLPLFEALGELFPELQDLIIKPVREALDYYRKLNEAAKDEKHRKSVDVSEKEMKLKLALEEGPGGDEGVGDNNEVLERRGSAASPKSSVVKSGSIYSMKSRRNVLLRTRSRSKSCEGEQEGGVDKEDNVEVPESERVEEDNSEGEDDDDDDEEMETITEVDVSEQTLKFKISTEAVSHDKDLNMFARKGRFGSRKGSQDRTAYQTMRQEDNQSKVVHKEGSVTEIKARYTPDQEGKTEDSQLTSQNDETGGSEVGSSPSKQGKDTSILSRLRSLTEKLSFSSDKESENSGAKSGQRHSKTAGSAPTSSSSHAKGFSQGFTFLKKTNTPAKVVTIQKLENNHQNPKIGKNFKTWAGKNSEGVGNTVEGSEKSRVKIIDPTSDSEVQNTHMQANQCKQESTANSKSAFFHDKEAEESSSGIVTPQEDLGNGSATSKPLTPNNQVKLLQHNTQEQQWSGSLDSVLQNKNRLKKKGSLSPESKRGFFARLRGTEKQHSQETLPASTSTVGKAQSRMSSIVGSFRKRYHQHHHHHHHQHAGKEDQTPVNTLAVTSPKPSIDHHLKQEMK